MKNDQRPGPKAEGAGADARAGDNTSKYLISHGNQAPTTGGRAMIAVMDAAPQRPWTDSESAAYWSWRDLSDLVHCVEGSRAGHEDALATLRTKYGFATLDEARKAVRRGPRYPPRRRPASAPPSPLVERPDGE